MLLTFIRHCASASKSQLIRNSPAYGGIRPLYVLHLYSTPVTLWLWVKEMHASKELWRFIDSLHAFASNITFFCLRIGAICPSPLHLAPSPAFTPSVNDYQFLFMLYLTPSDAFHRECSPCMYRQMQRMGAGALSLVAYTSAKSGKMRMDTTKKERNRIEKIKKRVLIWQRRAPGNLDSCRRPLAILTGTDRR